MRNFIFGDTGGHSLPLFNALIEIGADLENAKLPEGVRIIHLGDLIHKGNDSKLILKTVDRFIRNNPNQWVQILGNHEFQHIEGSPFFWGCDCDFENADIINLWLEEGLASAAAAIEPLMFSLADGVTSTESTLLFSHAGLTHYWWRWLENPVDAFEAAERINSLPVDIVTSAGEMLGVRGGNAGPVWATGNNEVFNGWHHNSDDMPFMQMHGHTSSFRWARRQWYRVDQWFNEFKELTVLNPANRAVVTRLSNNLLVGIDPGFGKTADLKVQPYLIFESKD
jgi:hypothetical protein